MGTKGSVQAGRRSRGPGPVTVACGPEGAGATGCAGRASADGGGGAGLEIVSAEPLPQSAWDAYYAPLRERVALMRAGRSDDIPQPIEEELRIYDSGLGPEWWRYVVFVGRKP